MDNAGSYDPVTGTVTLTGFQPESIVDGTTYISVTANAADDSVFKPLRNTLITLGGNTTTAIPDTDLANATVGVTN